KEENEPWRSKNVGSSSHSGIVQIVFGDGSVRCIPKKIDDGVLKKLLLNGLPSDEDLDQ
ncbi:MAG: H-X9-DG-CTERM domain-containing protein, partial [Pirellula sp.]